MFKEIPRYVGFPNQVYVKTRFAFDSFERMFKNKAPFFVSTFAFKDKNTPIIDNLFFDIDSYYGLRFPYRNVKKLKNWCYRNDLPYLINFSVSGDTPVLVKVEDELKLIPITEVIGEFKQGKYVETLSYSKDGNVAFSPVYNYLEHDEKIYNIYHEQSSLPLKLTEYHSIYKWKDSEIVKVKKNEIREGDFLVTFRNVSKKSNDSVVIKQQYQYRNKTFIENIKITDELLRLMGYYVAEGHTISDGTIGFSFNSKETEYHEEVTRLIQSLEPAKLSSKQEINVRESSTHVAKVILFSSQKFRPFFVEQCGSTQEYRHVPPFLFDMSKEKFMIFLEAYLNGDGCYKEKFDVTASTISKRLATELIWLCKMHGMSCTIRRERRKGNVIYIVTINKRDLYNRGKKHHSKTRDKLLPVDSLKKVYYQCKPKQFNKHRLEHSILTEQRAQRTSCDRILSVVKWFDETKSEEYTGDSKRIIDNYRKLATKGDIGFLKVRKITETSNKPEKVYDISVVDAENFFCGAYPILHSNSGGKGFHFYMILKPAIPGTVATQNRVRNMMYSLQMRIAEELDLQSFDEPTFGRLRFLMRYPTSRYIRKNEETGAFEGNGMFCRHLTDEMFDSGLKRMVKYVKEPGEVPKVPKSDITLQHIADLFDNFKLRHRQDAVREEKILVQRAGSTVPTIAALGLPCMQEFVSHSHPTHFERIELVAFMKYLGYTDIAINAFIKERNWTRYKYVVTSYQIRTIKPRLPNCTFLRKSYGHLCEKCVFKKRMKKK